TFARRCVEGLEANAERARELVERNAIIVTALNPHIGYDAGARIAKEAVTTGRSVRELVLEQGLMDEDALDAALDLKRRTEGGVMRRDPRLPRKRRSASPSRRRRSPQRWRPRFPGRSGCGVRSPTSDGPPGERCSSGSWIPNRSRT